MPNMTRLLLPEGPQPMEALGRAVRARRESMGVSQERMAELCGLDRTYYGGLERGARNPTIQAVFRVSIGLQWSPADLVGAAVDLMSAEDSWYADALQRGAVDGGA